GLSAESLVFASPRAVDPHGDPGGRGRPALPGNPGFSDAGVQRAAVAGDDVRGRHRAAGDARQGIRLCPARSLHPGLLTCCDGLSGHTRHGSGARPPEPQPGPDRAEPTEGERQAQAVALALAGLLAERPAHQSVTRDPFLAPGAVLAQALLHVGRHHAPSPLDVVPHLGDARKLRFALGDALTTFRVLLALLMVQK